jgi:hypothetical protein
MSAPDYAAIVRTLVDLFRSDVRLEDVHCTDEPDDPTAEQCPAVQVAFAGFSRTPRRMVNFQYGVGGFDEDLRLLIRATAFSAQSVADASRQRDDLVQTVQAVLGDNPTIGGTVLYAYATGGQPVGRAEGGSIYAAMDLTVTARVQS